METQVLMGVTAHARACKVRTWVEGQEVVVRMVVARRGVRLPPHVWCDQAKVGDRGLETLLALRKG